MPKQYEIKPFGLRALTVVGNDGAIGDLCGISCAYDEKTTSRTVYAAGVLVADYARVMQIDVNFSAGGITFDALAILTGRDLNESFINNIPGAFMTTSVGDRFPEVTIYAQALSDTQEGRVIAEFQRFRLRTLKGQFSQSEFVITEATGVCKAYELTLDTNTTDEIVVAPSAQDLIAYYDISQQRTTELDGAPMTELTDYGPENITLTTVTGAPTFAHVAAEAVNRWGAYVRGGINYFSGAPTGIASPPPYTIHAVMTLEGGYYFDNEPIANYATGWDVTPAFDLTILIDPPLFKFKILAAGSEVASTFYSRSAPIPVIVQYVIDAAGGTHTIRINTLGSPQASASAAGLVTSPSLFAVPGGADDPPSSSNFTIHELLWYNRKLSNVELNQMMRNSSIKWEVTLDP